MNAAITLVISGPPRTKKNSGSVIKRGGRKFHIASDAYREWDAAAQQQLAVFRASTDWKLPLLCDVNCAALFFRHALVGDAVGFYQALADILQNGGIVKNDKQIVQWDGSRMLKDAANPRVIVRLEPMAARTEER